MSSSHHVFTSPREPHPVASSAYQHWLAALLTCSRVIIIIISYYNNNNKLNNFLNRLLVEIIISSCLCVGFTEYKNLIIILNWLFKQRDSYHYVYLDRIRFRTDIFLLLSIASQVV